LLDSRPRAIRKIPGLSQSYGTLSVANIGFAADTMCHFAFPSLFALIGIASCGRISFDPVSTRDGNSNVESDSSPQIAPNFVFISKRRIVPGELQTLQVADTECQRDANTANINGTYRAYVSTLSANAKDRIGLASGWARMDGLPFANTADDIANGQIMAPVGFEADGTPVRSAELVMTGTLSGKYDSFSGNCDGLTNPGGNTGAGIANATGQLWSYGQSSTDCAMSRVYCFGIDRIARAPTPIASAGRRAFLSAPFVLNSGRDGADAKCQSEAIAAGLGGTFLALLATSTASASSRYDATAAPWVRLDGIPIATTAAEFLTNQPSIPLNLTTAGKYLGFAFLAWTGADNPQLVATSSCNDWTSTNIALSSMTANPDSPNEWFRGGATSCGFSGSVYCLEP
jgi:hypothetical protein